MLSSLAPRAAALRVVVANLARQNHVKQHILLMRVSRSSSSIVKQGNLNPTESPDSNMPEMYRRAAIAEKMRNWDKANEMFFGPERDSKNFPHPVCPEQPGKVRLQFIPDEWFTFMYPKTGVTGPYVFLWSMVAAALSKEVWVADHEFVEMLCFYGMFYVVLTKIVRPYISPEIEAHSKEGMDYMYFIPLANAKTAYNAQIDHCDHEIYRIGAQKYISEAKRENVALQLEGEYRKRLAEVHRDVKRRLDYVLEKETTEKRMHLEHMIDWIVSNVRKSITPDQESSSISQCIEDLKLLAKTHGGHLAV